jgi:hypothetical protein
MSSSRAPPASALASAIGLRIATIESSGESSSAATTRSAIEPESIVRAPPHGTHAPPYAWERGAPYRAWRSIRPHRGASPLL